MQNYSCHSDERTEGEKKRKRGEEKEECSKRPDRLRKGWTGGGGGGGRVQLFPVQSDDLLDAWSLEAASAALLLDLTG